jgi:hypothetical protein
MRLLQSFNLTLFSDHLNLKELQLFPLSQNFSSPEHLLQKLSLKLISCRKLDFSLSPQTGILVYQSVDSGLDFFFQASKWKSETILNPMIEKQWHE